ncbi:MAG: glycosyltransferase family 4 protein [Verrucomicrobia bacterium]|nr:glycosyltransferase family 4 protein [Verrucomicrobiota bacterium]
MKTGKLQIWVPELIAREGGIQSYSNEMLEAISAILGPDRVTVLSKSDNQMALRIFCGEKMEVHSTGHVPAKIRTLAFSELLLRKGLTDKPDLILSTHAHFSPVGRILAEKARTPVAISAHGVEVWGLPRGLTRNGLLASDTILPVSEYTRNRLMSELGLPAERFAIIHNTFDEKIFAPGPRRTDLRERYRLRPQDRLLLCVSRMEASEQYKGYRQIIQVMPALVKKIPGLKFMIVGRGSDRNNMERLARRLGVGDHVIFAGYVSSDELPHHYRLADAFAMPSKREGFGIVYLEAMGCGKRCLGGNKDAARDALRNGELGVLVDPDDLQDLEKGVVRLFQEPAPEPEQLHQLATQYFGQKVFREKVRQLLESFGLR